MCGLRRITLLVAAAACLLVAGAGAAKIPSLPKEFLKCKRNDNVCLKTAVQKALPFLVKGLPKLGLLSIDPLRVTEMYLDQGQQGPISMKLILKNQDLYGIGSATVDRIESNMKDDTYEMDVDVTIPTFILRGDYVVQGKVLVLPLQGSGKDNLTLTDLKATLKTLGHVVQRDGRSYVEVDDLQFRFDTTRLYIELENLFNGDKAVGDNMLAVLNENWRDVLDSIKPGIEEALGAVFKEVSRRVYSKVPYSVLFADN